MVIGFALEDERRTDAFRHACEKAYRDIDYVEVKKEYLWQKHWKNVDLFVIDDAFAKEHPKLIAKLDESQRILCIGDAAIKHDNVRYMSDCNALYTEELIPTEITEWIVEVKHRSKYEHKSKTVYIAVILIGYFICLFSGSPWLKQYGSPITIIIGGAVMIYYDGKAKHHPKPWLRTTCFVILMSLLFALCHWIFS